MAYKESSEDAVLPWQVIDAMDLRQGLHDVQKSCESRDFHKKPPHTPREVEPAWLRGLAHAVPLDDKLCGADLRTRVSRRIFRNRSRYSQLGTRTSR
jgi:hypothetical protein